MVVVVVVGVVVVGIEEKDKGHEEEDFGRSTEEMIRKRKQACLRCVLVIAVEQGPMEFFAHPRYTRTRHAKHTSSLGRSVTDYHNSDRAE